MSLFTRPAARPRCTPGRRIAPSHASRATSRRSISPGRQTGVSDEGVEAGAGRNRGARRRRARLGRALPVPARDARRLPRPDAVAQWPSPAREVAEILDELVEADQRARRCLSKKRQRSGDRPIADATWRDEDRAAELESGPRRDQRATLARRLDDDRRVAERGDDPVAARVRPARRLNRWMVLAYQGAAVDQISSRRRE